MFMKTKLIVFCSSHCKSIFLYATQNSTECPHEYRIAIHRTQSRPFPAQNTSSAALHHFVDLEQAASFCRSVCHSKWLFRDNSSKFEIQGCFILQEPRRDVFRQKVRISLLHSTGSLNFQQPTEDNTIFGCSLCLV